MTKWMDMYVPVLLDTLAFTVEQVSKGTRLNFLHFDGWILSKISTLLFNLLKSVPNKSSLIVLRSQRYQRVLQ